LARKKTPCAGVPGKVPLRSASHGSRQGCRVRLQVPPFLTPTESLQLGLLPPANRMYSQVERMPLAIRLGRPDESADLSEHCVYPYVVGRQAHANRGGLRRS